MLTVVAALLVGGSLTGCGSDDEVVTAASAPAAAASATAHADAASVPWNTASTIAVTGNDTVANGTASVSITTAPAHGTAVVDGTGIRYTPTAGYVGTDTLAYALTVGAAAPSTASVQIAVTASLTLSGTVTDGVLPGAVVVATIGGVGQPAVTADASGAYTLTLTSADPAAFVALKATGAGAQAGVVLTSLVGDVARAASAASPSGAVAAAALPSANVTNISTAVAVLTQQALGGKAPTSAADVASVQGAFTASQTIDVATAIKLIADAGVALPSGVTDTLALVSNATALGSFVAAQSVANPDLFTQTQAAVLSDPTLAVAPAVPVAGAGPQTLLLVLGEGAGGQVATRIVLNADKTATIEQDAVRTATWTSSATDFTLTYDQPIVEDAQDDGSGNQYVTTDTGLLVRQVSGTPGAGGGAATVTFLSSSVYTAGALTGQALDPGYLPQAQTIVGSTIPFTAADTAAGVRWAGVLTSDYASPTSGLTNQDVLRFVDGSTVLFERSKATATYVVTNGKLVLTLPGGTSTMTYQRLFAGPRGEERWLAEQSTGGVAQYNVDLAVVQVQPNVGPFTVASLTHNWLSYVNVGLVADKVSIDLLADGTGHGIDVGIDGSSGTFASGSTWSVDASGQMLLTNDVQHRTWQLLATAGKHDYVMEHLVYASGYDQYRLNVYDVAD